MTKDEALKLEALKYAASKGYGLRDMKIAPFTIKSDAALEQPEQKSPLQDIAQMQMARTRKADADQDKDMADRGKVEEYFRIANQNLRKPNEAIRQVKNLIKEQKT